MIAATSWWSLSSMQSGFTFRTYGAVNSSVSRVG